MRVTFAAGCMPFAWQALAVSWAVDMLQGTRHVHGGQQELVYSQRRPLSICRKPCNSQMLATCQDMLSLACRYACPA